ncbi:MULTISPECIES: hypothetical protein [unclassified Pseudomonas]|jgi:hypothetical protein|uniref:Uncharacterized protein n=2 Tax=Pseudomonas TaxID=286 RepID=A0A345UYT7_PSEFL|nr:MULTISPECIES: hypothetical protein [unclassified Pseudomonas]AXJ05639.1 hypothetical protein CFN16_16365 [Pseudomonas fluorescens]PNA04675.1 hypothetical protein C1X28_13910 [Pseudomonas sp. FW305-BF15]
MSPKAAGHREVTMSFDIFPTLEHEIRLSPPERAVTLIAACNTNEIGRFNVRETVYQTLIGSRPEQRKTQSWIFTSSVIRAQTDSRDRVMVFVSVKKKYLKKVSDSLNGWSCPHGTPMQVIKVQHGIASSQLVFANS